MIHCVSVGGQLHLHLYGDLQCYTWWQQVILFALLPLIILFPLSFGISLNMLKERSMSPTTFLFALPIPYITLVLYAKKKMLGLGEYCPSEEEKRFTKKILELEEELFSEDGGAVPWSSIQLYRNLLVVMLSTFIVNNMYRSVFLFPVFMISGLHDILRKPFEHHHHNYLQMLTSGCLLVVTSCNVIPSISIIFDVKSMSSMGRITKVVGCLEVLVLVVVLLFLPVWTLWKNMKENREKKQEWDEHQILKRYEVTCYFKFCQSTGSPAHIICFVKIRLRQRPKVFGGSLNFTESVSYLIWRSEIIPSHFFKD